METDHDRAQAEWRRPWSRTELEGYRHGRVRTIGKTFKRIKCQPLACGYRCQVLEWDRAVARDEEETGEREAESGVFFPFLSPLLL